MNLKVVISIVTAAIVIAGGALALSVTGFFAPAEDDALDLIPRDAAIYVNVFLDPSPSQKLALDDLLAHFPQARDRDAARDRLVELLDQGLAGVGLTFEDDIEPWLGDQLAFFMMAPASVNATPPLALLIEADDVDAALDAVAKAQANDGSSFTARTYKGIDYEVADSGDAVGAIESFVVSGSEAGVKAAIDAAEGESLASSERFERATADLEEDRLALGYFDFAPFARLGTFGPGATLGGPFNPANQGPTAFILYARSDALVSEASSDIPDDVEAGGFVRGLAAESKVLAELPGDAWFAAGAARFGDSLRDLLAAFEDAFAQAPGGAFPGLDPGSLIQGLEAQIGLSLEADLLSWMGDAGFFVSGDSLQALQGGALFEATDPKAARDALARIEGAIRKLGAPVQNARVAGADAGFALQEPGMPQPINIVAAGDRVVAVFGSSATSDAIGGSARLGDQVIYRQARDALGDGYSLSGFADLEQIVAFANQVALAHVDAAEDINAWLEPLSYVSFGAKTEGDSIVQRLVIGVR